MSSSRPQSRNGAPGSSSESSSRNFASSEQSALSFECKEVISGSFDDSSMIRGVLIQAIKRSGKSRAAIADEMEYLLARTITEKMLNAFTAESRDDRRWPAEFDRAFCRATGDNTLLACRAQLAGLHVITEDDKLLMDLGRQHLVRLQAEEQIELLQRRLHGRVA